MKILKSCFKPKEIIVSSFNNFTKTRSLNNIGNVGLLKYSSFFFLEFRNFNLNIFVKELVWRYLLAINHLRKSLLFCLIIKFKISSTFLQNIWSKLFGLDSRLLSYSVIIFITYFFLHPYLLRRLVNVMGIFFTLLKLIDSFF